MSCSNNNSKMGLAVPFTESNTKSYEFLIVQPSGKNKPLHLNQIKLYDPKGKNICSLPSTTVWQSSTHRANTNRCNGCRYCASNVLTGEKDENGQPTMNHTAHVDGPAWLKIRFTIEKSSPFASPGVIVQLDEDHPDFSLFGAIPFPDCQIWVPRDPSGIIPPPPTRHRELGYFQCGDNVSQICEWEHAYEKQQALLFAQRERQRMWKLKQLSSEMTANAQEEIETPPLRKVKIYNSSHRGGWRYATCADRLEGARIELWDVTPMMMVSESDRSYQESPIHMGEDHMLVEERTQDPLKTSLKTKIKVALRLWSHTISRPEDDALFGENYCKSFPLVEDGYVLVQEENEVEVTADEVEFVTAVPPAATSAVLPGMMCSDSYGLYNYGDKKFYMQEPQVERDNYNNTCDSFYSSSSNYNRNSCSNLYNNATTTMSHTYTTAGFDDDEEHADNHDHENDERTELKTWETTKSTTAMDLLKKETEKLQMIYEARYGSVCDKNSTSSPMVTKTRLEQMAISAEDQIEDEDEHSNSKFYYGEDENNNCSCSSSSWKKSYWNNRDDDSYYYNSSSGSIKLEKTMSTSSTEEEKEDAKFSLLLTN
ncbi:unnamed protein product [Amoebophrya sp. A120]|nr:unnamed protein product [Amoebophrya sp. A120]|eukprot:GSA120T00020064001.1